MSPDFLPLRDAIFPTRERENRFPFLTWENRISQWVENRGSLISVPLALREVVVFIADDLGFLGPRSPDLMTELCPPQDTA